jgi:hypothetical protein
MADFLSGLSLPAGWEVCGVAAAGVLVAFLAFFVGRRLGAPGPVRPDDRPAGPPPPDPFEVGSRTEKRAAVRRKGSSVEVLICDENLSQPPDAGWVLDRSLGGLGLHVERSAPVGTVLKVRPRNAPLVAPWVEVEVRSCKSEDGILQLGCAFRKTPPYSVLLLFG